MSNWKASPPAFAGACCNGKHDRRRRTPIKNAAQLQALGFALVIFPGGTVRAAAYSLNAYFESLKRHGTTAPTMGSMYDFTQINKLIGTPQMLESGKRHDGPGCTV